MYRGFIFPDRALLISIHSLTACCKCDFFLEDKNFSLKVTAAPTNNTKYKFILKCLFLFVFERFVCSKWSFYVTLCCKYSVVKKKKKKKKDVFTPVSFVLVLNKAALPHGYSHDTTSLHLLLPPFFPLSSRLSPFFPPLCLISRRA